jgi:hypothetical protein
MYLHWAEHNGLSVKEEEILASIPSGKQPRAASGGKQKKAKHVKEDKEDVSPLGSANTATAASAGPDIIITNHMDTSIDAAATLGIPSQASIGSTTVAYPAPCDATPSTPIPFLLYKNHANTTVATESTVLDPLQGTQAAISTITSSLLVIGDATDTANTLLTQSPLITFIQLPSNNVSGVSAVPTDSGPTGQLELKAPVIGDPLYVNVFEQPTLM